MRICALSYYSTPNDKILDFSSFFESILMKNGEIAEINYKTSLRLAYLIEKKPLERKEIISFFKKFYNLRSKMIHGREMSFEITFKKKKFSLSEIIEYIEKIIRRSVYNYTLLIENCSNCEDVINYLDNKIIGEKDG